jgi:hypothetical protein
MYHLHLDLKISLPLAMFGEKGEMERGLASLELE